MAAPTRSTTHGRGGAAAKIPGRPGAPREPRVPPVFYEGQKNVTHQHILDVGGKVLNDVMERKRKEQEDAVAKAVEEANHAADERQRAALKEARQQAKHEMEELRKDMKQREELAVERVRRDTKAIMETRTQKLLQEASEEAAKVQKKAIERCKQEASEAQAKAVELARLEEREAARQCAEVESQKAAARQDAAIAACGKDKEKALSNLKAAMLEEKKEAVWAALAAADEMKKREMTEQADKFQGNITELQDLLAKQVKLQKETDLNLRLTESRLQELQAKYDDLMREYKRFVDTVPKLSSGFLL